METIANENRLALIIKDSGLPISKAAVLLENFNDYFEIAAEWEKKAAELVVNDPSQLTEMRQAREGRLFLREKRIAIEKARKSLKEDSLREGRIIDSIAGTLTDLITPIEKMLEEKEKFAERMEAQRKEDLRRTRKEKLLQYTADADLYPLADMTEQSFADLLNACKIAFETRKEAEERAEQLRLENLRLDQVEQDRKNQLAPYVKYMCNTYDLRNMSDTDFVDLLIELKNIAQDAEAEQLRIKQENERLRKERDAIEKAEAEYRASVEAEKKEIEAKAKAEREEAEEAARKLLAIEREAKERAEREVLARAEADRKAEEARLAAEELELSKGDADKFADIIVALTALKTKHTFKSAKYRKLQTNVNGLIDKIIDYATK